MSKITRGWPPKRRREQAINIHKTKPWEKTTGPRTKAGKAKVATNAMQHGLYTDKGQELISLLRAQRMFARAALAAAKSGLP